MEKTLRFSDEYENFHPSVKYFHRSLTSPKSLPKFIVPWQLMESKNEKKMQKRFREF